MYRHVYCRRWVAPILAWSLALLLVASSNAGSLPARAAPAPRDWQLGKLPPSAELAPAALALPAGAERHPRLDSDLAGLAVVARASVTQARELAAAAALPTAGERVQVLVTAAPGAMAGAAGAISRLGGEVTGRVEEEGWLQAWVPVVALEALAAEPGVLYVRRPSLALPAATTEGLGAINGPAWQAGPAATTEGLGPMNGPAWQAGGYGGNGARVGIIDLGFQGYPRLLGSELPASVTVKNFVDGETDVLVDGGTVHGTACAEIVHDIAPGAELYLAKIATAIDLQEAVAWLRDTQHVNVISTSVTWYNLTPGDGTGFFADVVQSARNAGITWVTAAANEREAHWTGAFNDPDGDGLHNFNGAQEVDYFGPGDGNAYLIPTGWLVRVLLRWDDWSAVNQDYDLILVRWDGAAWVPVAYSNNLQNGGAGQWPVEAISLVTSGAPAPYGFVVQRFNSNRNVNLDIFAPQTARLDELVHERSLGDLAVAPAAITVAAVDVNAPYPQEPYSSEGPTNGPGGTAAGGRLKPDLAGYANVSTATYPTRRFSGTSPATPHAAGAAALVLGANPGYTPAQVQSFLEGRALDLGGAGKDTRYGAGRVFLGRPPNSRIVPVAWLPMVMRPSVRPLSSPGLNRITPPEAQRRYTVSWSDVPGATGYALEAATDPGVEGWYPAFNGSGTSHAFDSQGILRYYRVRALDGTRQGPWSTPVWVEVRWEEEPNDDYTQAAGSLASGVTYYGLPNDGARAADGHRDDYFMLDTKGGDIKVEVKNLTGSVKMLQVYHEKPSIGSWVCGEPDVIKCQFSGERGRYYIRVYSVNGTDTVYSVTATFP